nr:helix-turn-helix transcriptional regulator [Paenibacillus aceris]
MAKRLSLLTGRTHSTKLERKFAGSRARNNRSDRGGTDVSFHTRLKELRQQQNLTLRKLGEKAGVSYSILNSIENGRIQPSKDVVIALAIALKIEDKEELLSLARNASEG